VGGVRGSARAGQAKRARSRLPEHGGRTVATLASHTVCTAPRPGLGCWCRVWSMQNAPHWHRTCRTRAHPARASGLLRYCTVHSASDCLTCTRRLLLNCTLNTLILIIKKSSSPAIDQEFFYLILRSATSFKVISKSARGARSARKIWENLPGCGVDSTVDNSGAQHFEETCLPCRPAAPA
jgi:hypothetical protein